MKKTPYILILLLITSTVSTTGQETKPKQSHIWSLSLSAAPISTIYYYRHFQNIYSDYYHKGVMELIYPTGVNLRIDYKLRERLSISSGINFKKTNTDVIHTLGADMNYYENSTDTKYLFEIPVQVSYQILELPKFVDPYITTGIRNSYFKRNYVGDYIAYTMNGAINGNIDNYIGKFIMFCDLGVGTYIHLSKSFSLMAESNLTFTITGFGYIEILGGLRYSFR
jgi:hypothetical protein